MDHWTDRPVGDPASDDPTGSWRWWLRLQLWIAAAGALAWFAGAVLEEDFVAGVGCGLLIAALALRFGRSAARE